ncbi:helix-turn-helix domain-containing protein [Clostridium novyi]|uniref:Putative transcriptional regulator n=1 Tax=Clostridium novyi (strain NT) TaxID=386415 RepID=A0Q0X2_CLONN|nr:helix-turn-helix transcriptional regulator [Clostridium novyi]ABK60853.1 putative transcriptional regulator [Clostridium novyi NT]KEH88641.1 hypothetical protein Z966_00515 [Clostridium novyi A str. NCTC 538]
MKPYEKLKQLRISRNITTYELSELTGIPQSTISKMENGKRKIEAESLQKLADALNISVNEFFDSSFKDSTSESFDEDIRRIERARNKMPLKDKEKMMKILEASFEDYFDDEED